MILWLTVSILVSAIVLAYVLDRPIITPIPKSVLAFVRRIQRGPWLLTVWRAFLLVALLGVSGILVAGGGIVSGFIAAIIVTMLISDSVRAVVRDLWNANFVVIQP